MQLLMVGAALKRVNKVTIIRSLGLDIDMEHTHTTHMQLDLYPTYYN